MDTAAIRDRIEPILEAMIMRELIEQGAAPSAVPSVQQPSDIQLAALVPTLVAMIANLQPQQGPLQQPQSPLTAQELILIATLAAQPQQPLLALATLTSILIASLASQQRQSALVSAIMSALSGKLEYHEEHRDREYNYQQQYYTSANAVRDAIHNRIEPVLEMIEQSTIPSPQQPQQQTRAQLVALAPVLLTNLTSQARYNPLPAPPSRIPFPHPGHHKNFFEILLDLLASLK